MPLITVSWNDSLQDFSSRQLRSKAIPDYCIYTGKSCLFSKRLHMLNN